MYEIDSLAVSGGSWPQFVLPEEFIWSTVYIPKEPSARALLEHDGRLIALALNIQIAFHFASAHALKRKL